MMLFGETGQGWLQLAELAMAFVLCALVGLERELRQKSAGFRTHTLVGVSAALFMLVSKYGFMDVLATGKVVLDPSRVAAQIVSGIGFIGGGVIFMRRDVVRGLTTAASVWLTAALGMACGAGLPILALATAVGHFVIMLAFPRLLRLLPREAKTSSRLHVAYEGGRGLMRQILIATTQLRFSIDRVETTAGGGLGVIREEMQDRADAEGLQPKDISSNHGQPSIVELSMQVKGKRPVSHLIARLSDIDGVFRVGTSPDDED